jgi:hypothetical protein
VNIVMIGVALTHAHGLWMLIGVSLVLIIDIVCLQSTVRLVTGIVLLIV